MTEEEPMDIDTTIVPEQVDSSRNIVHFVMVPRPSKEEIMAKRNTRQSSDEKLAEAHFFTEAWKILHPLYLAKSLNQLPLHASYSTARVLACNRPPIMNRPPCPYEAKFSMNHPFTVPGEEVIFDHAPDAGLTLYMSQFISTRFCVAIDYVEDAAHKTGYHHRACPFMSIMNSTRLL